LTQYGMMLMPQEASRHRQAACTDAMKAILVGYQLVSSQGTADETTSFLLIAFESFLSVIRFNGLPNHSSPSTGADPSLGRMCTQAIANIARTSPDPFKATLAKLNDTERTLLEFAVRAEMSGYVVAGQVQVKKKLDLKSFAR
jgi:hypothetical protein